MIQFACEIRLFCTHSVNILVTSIGNDALTLAHLFLATACVCLSALSTPASDGPSRIVLRPEVSRLHREELITRLRVISGLSTLNFDNNGALRLGEQTSGGSAPLV